MSTSTDYQPVIPYLTVKGAAKAIEFYKAAFDAQERYRLTNGATDSIGHSELCIAGQVIMVADEYPGMSSSPETLGGSPTKFVLMVPNADAAYQRAIAAGATSVMPVSDQFYGYRMGLVRDPFGHHWMIQHEIEKIAPEDMQKRWDSMIGGCPQKEA